MDVVNNAILMVRVAPSNAYLIVGHKVPSPCIVYVVCLGYLFPSFFPPMHYFVFLLFLFPHSPTLLLSWFSQDYVVDAESVGIACSQD